MNEYGTPCTLYDIGNGTKCVISTKDFGFQMVQVVSEVLSAPYTLCHFQKNMRKWKQYVPSSERRLHCIFILICLHMLEHLNPCEYMTIILFFVCVISSPILLVLFRETILPPKTCRPSCAGKKWPIYDTKVMYSSLYV